MIFQHLLQGDLLFDLVTLLTAMFAGIVAAITGFGIGSLLTPLISLKLEAKAAIAVVAIPHFIATFVRFWLLRREVDEKVFIQFGITSVIGGLAGALIFWKTQSKALTIIFGFILIFSAVMEFTKLLQKIKFGKLTALIGGGISGFLGGMVGNQGGIRSAALLSFDLNKNTFVATATAIGAIVDCARLPIYIVTSRSDIVGGIGYLIVALIGVLLGT